MIPQNRPLISLDESRQKLLEFCDSNLGNFSRVISKKFPKEWSSIEQIVGCKNVSEKVYRFIFPLSGKCDICGGDCTYRSFYVGYFPTCGYKCSLVKESREKFGVDNKFQSEIVKNKSRETWKKNYGVDNPTKSSVIQEKARNTCIERYGGISPMQSVEVFCRQEKSGIKYKTYTFESGRTETCQGFEPFALDEIIHRGYSEDDIVVRKKDQPKILYLYNGKKRRYYPDLYVKSINTIIEVKSDYFYRKEYDKNQAKKDQCIRDGFKFEFWIFNNKKELTII